MHCRKDLYRFDLNFDTVIIIFDLLLVYLFKSKHDFFGVKFAIKNEIPSEFSISMNERSRGNSICLTIILLGSGNNGLLTPIRKC